ncbi:MAG: NAD(P)/FAD-dependent oxidoreductase [Ignavibacteriaceae bacterium]|nr:NAD(P)/FAD-dependent oxidoreductase [Ignavibacteriaceae bacterium]
MPDSSYFDVIILGAGAAGLMCGLTAASRSKSVLIIDLSDKPGKKILISGGGRCNFTNLNVTPENYLSSNPNFCNSALSRYTQYDFIDLVERHKIAYHEKTLGQLFCDGKSSQILNMLLEECTGRGVKIFLNTTVLEISKSDVFKVETTQGYFTCSSFVVASGGLSIPKMGATGFGYEIAKKFGLNIIEPFPGLVPLTFEKKVLNTFSDLPGVASDAIVSNGKISFKEAVLFTHKGLSGPAILQISSYMKPGDSVHINFFPDKNLKDLLMEKRKNEPKSDIPTILSEAVPKRLALKMASFHGLNKKCGEINNHLIETYSEKLTKWQFQTESNEGFDKAEVTCGGVDTNELSSKTFECRSVKGLYFIGEVLDVTGWLGGYNFQWAWSSGYAAGNAV